MSDIQRVKEASDIVTIIGQHVSLQAAGGQYRGLCPFHSERSPSFFVSPVMQRYKCFGCGEHGDVYDFLEKYEGLTLRESLELLAEQAGIELQAFTPTKEDGEKQQILEVLELSQKYFSYLLEKHSVGEKARKYLKDRKVSSASRKLFGIGVSTPAWDGLLSYLHKKKKYPISLLVDAGLVISRNGHTYDRFRNRVMFPLTNHRGQIVGFSGRALPGTEGEDQAKYINSPETIVYHKSELLFGLSALFKEIRKANSVVVTEGEFDVIASAQASVNNCVAIKGSALTPQHARLLRRYVSTIILSLDTDSAGREATKKAISVITAEGKKHETPMELRVAVVPSGKDPADLVAHDPGAWRDTVKASVTAYDYLITTALKQYDIKTPSGKRQVMIDLAPVLQQVSHAVEREHYINRISKALGVSEQSIEQDLKRTIAQGLSPASNEPEKKRKEKSSSVLEQLERVTLFLLLHSPDEKRKERAEELLELELETTSTRAILKYIVESDRQTLTSLRSKLPSDLSSVMAEWYLDDSQIENFDHVTSEKEWRQVLKKLQVRATKVQLAEISRELRELDLRLELSSEETARQAELLQKVVELQRTLG